MNPDRLQSRLPTLEGDGVQLRWLEEADLPALLALFGDPEVVRFMAISRLRSRTEAELFLQSIVEGFQEGSLYQWGVELDGQLVGTCTLAGINRDNRHAEIGFALDPARRGRGVMVRAVRPLLDFAFGQLDMHRIEADVDPRNTPSIRLLEKQGFTREGLLRERYLEEDGFQDAIIYGLLRREWSHGGGGS
ncbi:GNAT family N-acetyltransferase [Microbulbifer yueqingensis]|uniref:Protein N-acetyltransferase, RimJ/RimL family n=1 Tax=Microbulbifer yueqingensis TaxID=658219 RepID=A0A1G9CRV6_9GAMM|nr:GNAT family protein [Microbulbifer yueqingensis]SDK54357.1 Protein N-acetyltransferase, RimJ/RimL family [Microbulbifer yueqingensis]